MGSAGPRNVRITMFESWWGGGEATDSGTKGQLRSDSSNWLPRLHTWLVPRLPTRTNEDEDESQLRDVEEGEGH